MHCICAMPVNFFHIFGPILNHILILIFLCLYVELCCFIVIIAYIVAHRCLFRFSTFAPPPVPLTPPLSSDRSKCKIYLTFAHHFFTIYFVILEVIIFLILRKNSLICFFFIYKTKRFYFACSRLNRLGQKRVGLRFLQHSMSTHDGTASDLYVQLLSKFKILSNKPPKTSLCHQRKDILVCGGGSVNIFKQAYLTMKF